MTEEPTFVLVHPTKDQKKETVEYVKELLQDQEYEELFDAYREPQVLFPRQSFRLMSKELKKTVKKVQTARLEEKKYYAIGDAHAVLPKQLRRLGKHLFVSQVIHRYENQEREDKDEGDR